MAYLQIMVGENDTTEETKNNRATLAHLTKYDFSAFSLKNTYTGELGNTIIYPVKMQKIRISFTAELYGGEEFERTMRILRNPEFFCKYRNPESEENKSGFFTVISDISVNQVVTRNGLTDEIIKSKQTQNGLFTVSATIEEV